MPWILHYRLDMAHGLAYSVALDTKLLKVGRASDLNLFTVNARLAPFQLCSYAQRKAWGIVVSLYSDMSEDDLTVLKSQPLTRIEAIASMSVLLKKSEGADRIKQLQERLIEVEAGIVIKEKLH